mmetsp:Transcript_26356/g.40585  ORF Transcript_26356/g.40585 Transcript_26356/m.40585 type:complete len:482 (+) Transcript_26356:54-1499(+)
MDNSTHSSSSSSQPNQATSAAASSATNAAASTNGPAASSTSSSSTPKRAPNPQQAQLIKLRDANTKYKNLLKLAKERIQEQEGLLDERRSEVKQLTTKLNETTEQYDALKYNVGGTGASSTIDLNDTTIVRVCQRIKDELIDDNNAENNDDATDNNMDTTNDDGDDSYEIWALIEYETANPDGTDALNPLNAPSFKRHKQWQKFTNESALSDYIRRDTGEPLTLPPYSLSPEQSQKMAEEAKRSVASISEEFRRFRVRAEVAKKQADATVRALHTNSVQTTRMRIEGQDIESELKQAKTDHAQLASLRAEMAEQEARWKESYDLLMAENEKLKSSGAEALLAAQWRHRYESCLKEKEAALTSLGMEKEKVAELQDQKKKTDAGKYEAKYRDLKESFRLYRKKAKEIFMAQQQGETGFMPTLHDSGAEGAKISYLKNLMVNYLGSDAACREHMEPAIATVLNFTEDDLSRIKQQKEQNESWF